MQQSKRWSLIETISGTIFGFFLSLAFWQYFVAPVENLPVAWDSNLRITLYFTALSIFRGYIVRRFFENITKIKNWINKLKGNK